ncbi:MAG: hypothetical protein AAGK74_09625, partial [Chloroflexota bacterium]
ELGTVSGNVSGGEWAPDGRSVIVGSAEGILSAAGSAAVIIPGGQLTSGQAFSPNGRFVFYHNGGGYSLAGANGANPVTLPGRNDATAAGAGLWADSGAVVAYWTFTDSGTSALNVTGAASGETLTLDSGTSVPVTPLGWLPNSQTLLYRSAQGVVAVDASCVQRGCAQAPAQTAILPVTVANVLVTDSNVLVFAGNGGVFGVNANCVNAGNCADNAVSAGAIAGNSRVAAGGNTLAFTGANNQVNTLNAGCVNSGACTPTATGVTGGVLDISPRGTFALVNSGGAVQVLNLSNPAGMVSLNGINSSFPLVWNG